MRVMTITRIVFRQDVRQNIQANGLRLLKIYGYG